MARISEWSQRPGNLSMPPEVVALIARRRRQMLVHCFLYYDLDESTVTDHKWMQWAQELADLQRQHGTRINFYDTAFADWDGSTGFQLGGRTDPDVEAVARRLLKNPQLETS